MDYITENPAKDWGTETLKRKFSELYRDVYIHELRDGVLVRSTLKLMELELRNRQIDPETVVA